MSLCELPTAFWRHIGDSRLSERASWIYTRCKEQNHVSVYCLQMLYVLFFKQTSVFILNDKNIRIFKPYWEHKDMGFNKPLLYKWITSSALQNKLKLCSVCELVNSRTHRITRHIFPQQIQPILLFLLPFSMPINFYSNFQRSTYFTLPYYSCSKFFISIGFESHQYWKVFNP